MVEAPEIVHNHLRSIRSDSNYGLDSTRKLVQCFSNLTQTHGICFTTLSYPLDHLKVKVFTDKEFLDHLRENGKFNKK